MYYPVVRACFQFHVFILHCWKSILKEWWKIIQISENAHCWNSFSNICSVLLGGSSWFYFRMLHAVWVWHLHYLETCFISLFQTKSAANWFEHLDDFCEHMFLLSSYVALKMLRDTRLLVNCGVSGVRGSTESFLACDVIVKYFLFICT